MNLLEQQTVGEYETVTHLVEKASQAFYDTDDELALRYINRAGQLMKGMKYIDPQDKERVSNLAKFLLNTAIIDRNLGDANQPRNTRQPIGGKPQQAPSDSDDDCPIQFKPEVIAQDDKSVLSWEEVQNAIRSTGETVLDDIETRVRSPLLQPELFKAANIYPKNLLLYGPGGTGKTEFARSLAKHTNLILFSVSSPDIKSKWVGVAEKCFKKLLETAQEAARHTRWNTGDSTQHNGVVVFIDEVDALLGEDSMDKSSGGDIIAAFKALLQKRVTQSGVIVVAATNRPWMIKDTAIKRRFDIRLYLGLPGEVERLLLLRSLCKRYGSNETCEREWQKQNLQMGPSWDTVTKGSNDKAVTDLTSNLIMYSAGLSRAELAQVAEKAFTSQTNGIANYKLLSYCQKSVTRPDRTETRFWLPFPGSRFKDSFRGGETDQPNLNDWQKFQDCAMILTWEAFAERYNIDAKSAKLTGKEKEELLKHVCWTSPQPRVVESVLKSQIVEPAATIEDLCKFRSYAQKLKQDGVVQSLTSLIEQMNKTRENKIWCKDEQDERSFKPATLKPPSLPL